MFKIHECLQKADSYPAAHMILHAAAVIVPVLLFFWHPIASSISVASWAVLFLIIGAHDDIRALGGHFAALGISIGLGLIVAIVTAFGPWALWAACSLIAAALAWLAEYNQNAGHWCGEDRAGLLSRLKGSALGSVGLAAMIGLS